MSFLSVLKKIGHGVEVGEKIIEPFEPVLAVVPGFGPVFDLVFHGIQLAEQLVGPDNGPTKKDLVLKLVNSRWPNLPQAALGGAVDVLVAALNQLNAAANAPVLVSVPVAPK